MKLQDSAAPLIMAFETLNGVPVFKIKSPSGKEINPENSPGENG